MGLCIGTHARRMARAISIMQNEQEIAFQRSQSNQGVNIIATKATFAVDWRSGSCRLLRGNIMEEQSNQGRAIITGSRGASLISGRRQTPENSKQPMLYMHDKALHKPSFRSRPSVCPQKWKMPGGIPL